MEPEDFVHPEGELTEDLFPTQDLTALITAWITQGEAKATAANLIGDRHATAVGHWVYYRAYTAVANAFASEPDTLSRDMSSRTIGANRIKHFRNLASSNKGRFDHLTRRIEPDRASGGIVRNRIVF